MPSSVRQEISMPGTSATPCSRAARGGFGPAVGGVMVGQGDDVEPAAAAAAITSAGASVPSETFEWACRSILTCPA